MPYLTKTIWPKTAKSSLEIHLTEHEAVRLIQYDLENGAVSVHLFEIQEVEYEIVSTPYLRILGNK